MYRRRTWRIIPALAALTLVVAACQASASPSASQSESESPSAGAEITIGFAISSFDNDFFVTLAAAAEDAAADAGVTLTVSDAGGDAATQASQVEDFITQAVDVILLNPVDSDAIVASVEAANEAGIPVITVDRGATGGEVVSHIASDNVAGGQLAGEFLFEQMGGEGGVLELEGIPGTSAARDRGQGFQQALDAAAGIERLAKQTANFARDEGLTVAQNLLQAHPDAAGLFAHNDDMALGAVEAAAAAGSDLIIVGFDAAPDALQAIKDGTMAGTIAQQPDLMGALAVATAIRVANGESVDAYTPVEIALVTADNVDDFLP